MLRNKIILAACLLFCTGGCIKIPVSSDWEIQKQKEKVAALPEGEEKEAEQKKLDDMVETREKVDGYVASGSGYLNTLIPGSGFLIAGAYGLWQKVRGRKSADAAAAVISGVKQYADSKLTNEEKAELFDDLKKVQDVKGARAYVKEILEKLENEDKPKDK